MSLLLINKEYSQKRKVFFILLIVLITNVGCNNLKLKNTFDYDYIITDIYLKRDTIHPSEDVLVFETKLYNPEMLRMFKNSQFDRLSLKTSFINYRLHAKIKALTDSCYIFAYPTPYFIFNQKALTKPIYYTFYFKNKKLNRDIKSQLEISSIDYN